MPRSYRHIKEYALEILKLKTKEKNIEICEKFGFEIKQLTNFIIRYNRNQRKLAAEIALKRKDDRQKIILSAKKTRYRTQIYSCSRVIKNRIIGNGKRINPGFYLAHRKKVRKNVKYMVIHLRKEKY